MKFLYEDVPLINRVMLELYRELPEDVRLGGDSLTAAEVLMEAVEYLRYLKNTQRKILVGVPPPPAPASQTPLRPTPPTLTPQARPTTERKYVQNKTPKVQNICLPAGSQLVHLPGVGQAIRLAPPGAPPTPGQKSTIIQLQPGARVAICQEHERGVVNPPSQPRPTVLRPTAPALGTGSTTTLLRPSGGQSVLRGNKPITIMARDPQGVTRPITIIPASSQGSTAGSSSVQVRVAGGSSSASGVTNVASTATPRSQFLPWRGGAGRGHDVYCKPGCTCPLSDDQTPVPQSHTLTMFDHLEKGLAPNHIGEEFGALRSYDVRQVLYQTLVLKLKRVDLHKFLRTVAMTHTRGMCDMGCIAIKIPPKGALQKGIIRLTDEARYSLILAVFKLFRRDDDTTSLNDPVIITSRKECRISAAPHYRGEVICLNPWHFERTDPFLIKFRAQFQHTCESRLRVLSHNAMKYVCPICQITFKTLLNTDEVTEKESNGFLQITDPKSLLAVSIKEEPMDVSDISHSLTQPELKSETLDEDFDDMVDNFEKEVDEATDADLALDPLNQEEPEPEPSETEAPDAEDNLDADDNHDGSSNEADDAALVAKKPDIHEILRSRCEHCLQQFPALDMIYHECSVNNKNSGLYACHCCGYCDNDLDNVVSHLSRCRSFGVKPRKDFAIHDARPKYPDKNRKIVPPAERTCSKCSTCFVTIDELEVHYAKNDCASHCCEDCEENFTLVRPHCCLNYQLEKCEDIKYISVLLLSPPDKLKTPTKCKECDKLYANRNVIVDHLQTQSLECEMCNKPFISQCKLLSHSCDYLAIAS